MRSILIADTTREQREQIVSAALGDGMGGCDEAPAGLVEMYQAYIDGEMELREVNMAYRARYVSADSRPPRSGCMG